MSLDHKLASLDYSIEAARGSLEITYALDYREEAKDRAWRQLADLEDERAVLLRRYEREIGTAGPPDLNRALREIYAAFRRMARRVHALAQKYLPRLEEARRNASPASRRRSPGGGQLTRSHYRRARPAGAGIYERTSTWRM